MPDYRSRYNQLTIINMIPTSSVFIYYDQSVWHELIGYFIRPFLSTETASGRLKSYALYLDNKRGDHIRLVLGINADKKAFEEEFGAKIESFLKQRPSVKTKIQTYPLKGFFMDYENNSFWFDHYDSFFIIDQGGETINQRISGCLMDALGEQEIERDMIYTFLIYMQLGALKAAFPVFDEACGQLVNWSGQLLVPTDEEAMENTENSLSYGNELAFLFENNKDILKEILMEIWNENGYSEDIPWMEDWVNICKLFIGSEAFQPAYLTLCKLVYRHAGFVLDNYLLSISLALMRNAFHELHLSGLTVYPKAD